MLGKVRTHRIGAVGTLSLLLLAAPGCVKQPTMHLNHAEIGGVQLGTYPPSLLMTVVIDVYNPNSYDVAVRAVRGQTILADQFPLPVFFQAPPQGIWMAAGQTTPVRVPLTVPLPVAIALVQQGFASPTIPYRFVGTADVTGTRTFQIEKDNYSVDERGMITRQDMLAVIPSSLFGR
jgi:hypothetical protein